MPAEWGAHCARQHVENRRMMLCPVNGLMMNMWAVEGKASMGMRFE